MVESRGFAFSLSETMMASLPHVVPFIVPSVSQWSDMLDKQAADCTDVSLVEMKALQGAAVASLFRVFSELSPEELREIDPLSFGDEFEMLLQSFLRAQLIVGERSGDLSRSKGGCVSGVSSRVH